jgi:hypothetical protein
VVAFLDERVEPVEPVHPRRRRGIIRAALRRDSGGAAFGRRGSSSPSTQEI